MSSIFETLDFANDFFGQPNRSKEKVSRRDYRTGYIDYYDQSLDTTGIKADLSRVKSPDEVEERGVDISQVGFDEPEGQDSDVMSDMANLSSGIENALSSSSSLSYINASFVDYNTSLQNAGFKDRSQSFLSKNFGISLASMPQSGKEARTDIVGTFTTEKGREALAVSAAKKGLGFLGVNPIATSLLSGFATGTTVQDPLGNPSYRPNHAVLGTVMDINFSMQSNNISQSIAAMNANLDVPYSQRGAVGYFGYDPTNGQLISRAPLGKTWTGTTNLSIEQLSNLEALSKGFTTRGYNNQTERGERLAMGTDTVGGQTFGGYSNNGFHHGINGSSRTGTMAQAEKAAKGYGITTKQFTDILSKVRKNNTFFGKPKNEKFTVDFLARKQFRDNESAGGANSMGLETDVNAQQSIQNALSGKTPPSLSPSVGTSVSTSQGAVGSTGGLGGGYGFGENNDSDGPDSSASTSGVSDSTRYGGKVGKGFALGGRGNAEPAGFIEGPPEQFSDQTTIADDIPLKVKDGTFVINAPAVEYEGSPSIQKMLAEGYEKAMTRDIGVDKNFRIGKIPSRGELDIQISRGEVVVPPHVAKVIGYDKLEEINNKGKREVTRRQKAGDQEKVQAGQGFAAEGGNQKVTIFRGEPYPEQIGDFDKKYMSGRRMTGAWFSSNKNYAKNYGDLQKTLDVTFDEYAKGAKKAEMYRNIASMQSESGSRQLTKDQKKKLFKHVKEIKQFAKMVQEGKADPSRFVNTLHMSIFPDKKDEATIRKIESYKNNPKLFAKLVVRGLANNIVNKGIPVASRAIPGIGALAGFSPKEMGDATLSGKEGFIYNMTPVKDEVTSLNYFKN